MTITIYEGYDSSYVIIKAKNENFRKRYGGQLEVPVTELFKTMLEISVWVNNDLGDACLFEVE